MKRSASLYAIKLGVGAAANAATVSYIAIVRRWPQLGVADGEYASTVVGRGVDDDDQILCKDKMEIPIDCEDVFIFIFISELST